MDLSSEIAKAPYTLTAQEVAEMLGMSRRRFYERLAGLEAEGFPARLPGCGARWGRFLVTEWIRLGGRLYELAPVPSPEGQAKIDDVVAKARRRLDARYAGSRP
ncbi:MAG: hypothetical protein AB7S41_11290 [Parvibaculaceae bacterium]